MKRIPNNISLSNIIWIISPYTKVRVIDVERPRVACDRIGTLIYDGLAKDIQSINNSSAVARACNSKVYGMDIENEGEITVVVCTKWEQFR